MNDIFWIKFSGTCSHWGLWGIIVLEISYEVLFWSSPRLLSLFRKPWWESRFIVNWNSSVFMCKLTTKDSFWLSFKRPWYRQGLILLWEVTSNWGGSHFCRSNTCQIFSFTLSRFCYGKQNAWERKSESMLCMCSSMGKNEMPSVHGASSLEHDSWINPVESSWCGVVGALLPGSLGLVPHSPSLASAAGVGLSSPRTLLGKQRHPRQ